MRRPCVTPPRTHRHDHAGARSASARHCRQRRCERCAAATAPGEEPTAPRTILREREPPSTTHRAGRASRRCGATTAKCHAAMRATTRPSQRQERQRGVAGSGAASAALRPTPSERKRQRPRLHAGNANRRAQRTVACERATAAGPRRPSVTPTVARRHDQASARSASAAPQAAAPRAPCDSHRPHRGSDRAGNCTQGARGAEHYVPCQESEFTAVGPRRPCVTPPRTRRHDQASAKSASAKLQAAALRAPCNGHRPRRGTDRADDHTQRARAAEHNAPSVKASHLREAATTECHAAASAAARPSQRQERQRSTACRGAASAARRPLIPERKRLRKQQHA